MSDLVHRRSAAGLHARMRMSFRRAIQDLPAAHRSRLWDFYDGTPIDERLPPELWPELRRQPLLTHMGAGNGRGLRNISAHSIQGQRILQAWNLLKAQVGTAAAHALINDHIGAPVGLTQDSRVLEMADLHLALNAAQIRRHYPHAHPNVVLEVGGGYGGLAAKLKTLFPSATIAIFDLPEANAIQLAFLSQCFPTARIATYDDYKADCAPEIVANRPDFLLLPGHTIADFPAGCADLAINLRSMQEMRRMIVAFYIAEIGRTLRPGGIFYCVNRYQKLDTGEAIRIKEFPFDNRWDLLISQQVAHQDSTHELVLRRREQPAVAKPSDLLAVLPPTTLRDVRRNPGLLPNALRRWILGGHPLNEPGIPGYFRAMRILAMRRILVLARHLITAPRGVSNE